MKKGNMVSENESMLVSEGKWTPQVSPCNCQRRLSVIEDKIECMSLKIDEISSNLNISFTKHMETYGKLV